MIRLLVGATLPLLGLGAAAAYISPDLLTGARGEPMIMASADQAKLQAASFDGTACSSKLLFSDPSDGVMAGTHIVAFALRSGASDVAVEVEDFSGDTKSPKTIVLVFDDAGHLVAAGNPESLHLQAAVVPGSGCVKTPDVSSPRAPI